MDPRSNASRYNRLAVRLSQIDDPERLARAIVAAAREATSADTTLPPAERSDASNPDDGAAIPTRVPPKA